ncbi:MAG: hypothetical protein IKD76_06220 [Clostridia bacterium]|nr:hypothetical protein [Clostridia bacterium]
MGENELSLVSDNGVERIYTELHHYEVLPNGKIGEIKVQTTDRINNLFASC